MVSSFNVCLQVPRQPSKVNASTHDSSQPLRACTLRDPGSGLDGDLHSDGRRADFDRDVQSVGELLPGHSAREAVVNGRQCISSLQNVRVDMDQ